MTTPTRRWPELRVAVAQDTIETVHLWSQVIGKIRLAIEPTVNHWWQVPLYVSARGLTTSLLHADVGLEIEFDFLDNELVLRTTQGQRRTVELKPRTVASFFEATMAALADLDVQLDLLARPVEVVDAVPFAEDVVHDAYDPAVIRALWLGLVEADRVLRSFRSRFVGKASPVHFFWGAFDLATTRFSGRTAPPHPGGIPNCADWVMQEAYSHEVSSCGYWPCGSDEGSFYAYAYPEPAGFAQWPIEVEAAFYDADRGEFMLPYRAVRTADDPDRTLLAFLQNTYDAAATLGHWDRATLEAQP